MRWQGRRQSSNVEDRRGTGGRGLTVGGGVGAVIALVIYLFFGGKGDKITQITQSLQKSEPSRVRTLSAHEKELGDFAAVILADTEDVWNLLFKKAGRKYREPKMVLFSGATGSACGYAQSATGPFYCPGDEKVYIDLEFFEELQRRLDAQGDFAMAYVIAHEIGHHVQKLLGIMDQKNQMRERLNKREFNRISIQLELQADFLAGVWTHHAQRMKNILEEGDIEEGINAAGAVGDDRIQKKTRGYVVPDSFTHGTSAQRTRWFLKGWKTGDINQGNTFDAREL
ncbi:MAG: zinc metallopeptidase [Candidatus Aminicenantes bacterium]|nr:zinc metallopeptidase [Candidatus Aminicenantes bacterium]